MKEHNNSTVNMVNSLIRSSNVIDQKVLNVLEDIARNDFVPEKFMDFAYADYRIPIANNRKMLSPSIEGKILQSLDLKGEENIIKIGIGTGYMACCLSRLCRNVHSIDTSNDLIGIAKKNIEKYNDINNLTLEHADIQKKWEMVSTYDVVVITSYIPHELILTNHLKEFSKAFLFVGSKENPIKKGILVKKFKKDSLTKNILFETDTDPLI